MGSTISWETQEGGKNIPKSNKCFVPSQGQGAGPGVCCEGGRVAWDLCGDKQDKLCLLVLLREKENPLWSPGVEMHPSLSFSRGYLGFFVGL